MTMLRYLFVFLAVFSLLISGCSGGNGGFEGTLEPVTGLVQSTNGPEEGVQVTFQPTGNTPGTGATAVTDKEGKFQFRHQSGGLGVEAGEYRVLFSKMTRADGAPFQPDDDTTLGVEALPPQYQDPERTPERVSVNSGGGEFSFTLKLPKK